MGGWCRKAGRERIDPVVKRNSIKKSLLFFNNGFNINHESFQKLLSSKIFPSLSLISFIHSCGNIVQRDL
jgi:hypothetical protein